MQKITRCLWFDGEAADAADFYLSVFKNSNIVSVMHYGATERCGWLRDKFGISWQIVPTILGEMLRDRNAQKSMRVMQAMLAMVKLDISRLKQAYAQE